MLTGTRGVGLDLDKWDVYAEYGVVYSRVNICPYINSVNTYNWEQSLSLALHSISPERNKDKGKKKKKKQSLTPEHIRYPGLGVSEQTSQFSSIWDLQIA